MVSGEPGWVARAASACERAAARLRGAGVEPEALAEYLPEARRFGVFRKSARMRPLGEVWRLGVLLLEAGDRDPALYAAGRSTRSLARGRPGYQSVSREDRRDIAAAALQGGFPEGTPVHFDATPLPLTAAELLSLTADAPIGVQEIAGEVAGLELRVRWRAGAGLEGAPTLEQYLEERVGLLVDPPLSST